MCIHTSCISYVLMNEYIAFLFEKGSKLYICMPKIGLGLSYNDLDVAGRVYIERWFSCVIIYVIKILETYYVATHLVV